MDPLGSPHDPENLPQPILQWQRRRDRKDDGVLLTAVLGAVFLGAVAFGLLIARADSDD